MCACIEKVLPWGKPTTLTTRTSGFDPSGVSDSGSRTKTKMGAMCTICALIDLKIGTHYGMGKHISELTPEQPKTIFFVRMPTALAHLAASTAPTKKQSRLNYTDGIQGPLLA